MKLVLLSAVVGALHFLPTDRVTYYDVDGRTAGEVRATMNKRRPTTSGGLRVDAWTTWDIHWRYRYNPAPAGCVVTSLDVTLTTAMTLPRWTAASTAPVPLRNRWEAYYAALIEHERRHLQIAELAMGAIREAGPRITTSECSEMATAIDRKGQQLLAEYRKREVQYDAETNHGMKQGAKFP